MSRLAWTLSRRGLGLAEIMLAVAIIASLLLVVFDLVRSSGERVRLGRERATARMVLLDLMAIVQNRGPDELRARLTPEGLNDLLAVRLTLVPDPEKAAYQDQVRELTGHLRGILTDEIDATSPGLVRVDLIADIPGRDPVQIAALYRPSARVLLPANPDGPCLEGVSGAP